MKKMIKRFFTENLSFKVLALVFSVLLWLAGMNVNNPRETKTFRVPLEIRNEAQLTDARRVIQNRDTLEDMSITLRVRATVSELDGITEDDFTAYINMGLIEILSSDIVGKPVPTTVFIDSKFDEVISYPTIVDVQLDHYSSTTKEVKVVYENEPKEGFSPIPAEVNPEKVTISGAKTSLALIDRVETVVDVKGKDNTFKTNSVVKIYDIDGYDVTKEFEISDEIVEVEVPIYKEVKVPIELSDEFIGEAARGYEVAGYQITPSYAFILGPPDVMEDFNKIELDPIDISGATEDIKEKIDLRLPPEISIVYGTPSEVLVSVKIEGEKTKRIEMDPKSLSIHGLDEDLFTFEFRSNSITFELKGAKSNVENLSGTKLLPSIEVSSFGHGDHIIPIDLILPDGVEIVGSDPTVAVTITEKEVEIADEEEEILPE